MLLKECHLSKTSFQHNIISANRPLARQVILVNSCAGDGFCDPEFSLIAIVAIVLFAVK